MSICISSGGKEIITKVLDKLGKLAEKPEQKKFLEDLTSELEAMPICSVPRARPRKPRKISDWQLCIKEERVGKPFDPEAMKKLAPKYKAGTCPTREFVEKFRRGEI